MSLTLWKFIPSSLRQSKGQSHRLSSLAAARFRSPSNVAADSWLVCESCGEQHRSCEDNNKKKKVFVGPQIILERLHTATQECFIILFCVVRETTNFLIFAALEKRKESFISTFPSSLHFSSVAHFLYLYLPCFAVQ